MDTSPKFELTGDAIMGIGPSHTMAMVSQLPTTVCLGRNAPAAPPSCLNMAAYIDARRAMAGLPGATNYRDKAAASIARPYKNNQWGCCVFSSVFHRMGIWAANDSDSGGEVFATDSEVEKQYFAYTGGRDVGANIAEVLNLHRTRGFVASGKTYKIDGFVSLDHTKQELIKAAIYLFGNINVGFDLPGSWMNNARWTVANAGSTVGGHDVTLVDYDNEGIYTASWGRLYLWEWAAVLSTRWIDECYASLAPLWYGSDKLAPCGFAVDALQADLTKIHGGEVPDITPPLPPGPMPGTNIIRLTKPLAQGLHGDIILGSALPAGDYDALLLGEGPPPNVP